MNGFNLDNLLDELNLLITTIGVIIGPILAWLIFKKEPTQVYLQQRYEKVVFPIFNILEKHLFTTKISPNLEDDYEKCKEIIRQNQLLVGGKLKYLFSLELNQKNFSIVSKEIDSEYDRCCKQLGIPVRTIYQKLSLLEHRPKRLILHARLKFAIPVWAIFLMLYFGVLITIRVLGT